MGRSLVKIDQCLDFKNAYVAWDNETNFRESWMLAEVLLNFKMGRSPVETDQCECVWAGRS